MATAAAAATNGSTEKDIDPIERVQHQAAEEVFDFLSGLGSTGEIKVQLFRKEPERYKGTKVDGLLDVFQEPFGFEKVRDLHGGGKFMVKVQKRSKAGRMNYAGTRTFDVAGVPKLENLPGGENETPPSEGTSSSSDASDGAVGHALNMAASVMRDAQAEARDLRTSGRTNGGMDESVRMMLDSMQDRISNMQSQLIEKDNHIVELLGRRPDTSGQDRLFDIMDKSSGDHASRINEIRIAHDSELRQLRDYNHQELRNRENRFEKELDAVREGHQREIDSMRESNRFAAEAQKNAYEMRMDGLKESQTRLERELHEARTEIAGLRAKKDQSPIDQIQGLVSLKNGMEALMPTGTDDPQQSTAERVVSAIIESPVAQGLAARIADGGKPEQSSSGQQMVSVRGRDGNVHQIPASYVAQMKAQQAHEETPKSAADMLDESEVKTAVAFMEQAYRNGHAPETVAASARNLVPSAILEYLKHEGVDNFLNNVARLDDSSPLATVAGRMYIRKIARFLLTGSSDESEAEPAPEPEGDVIDQAVDAAEGDAVE